MNNDVIAAIVSGLTYSGVGIIRVSGEKAVEVCENVVKIKGISLKDAKTRHVYYGHIFNEDVMLDEALIFVMKAPHSFTAENVVEIQCHGGPLIMEKILEAVCRQGARPAEPGEFSKRAFLNGRIDLSQAEAIMELIQSENDFAMKSSLNQLNGVQSQMISEIRQSILYEIAHIEAALDDPEHMSLDGYPEELDKKTENIMNQISELLKNADNGRRLAEGIPTVILGKPNAGKSSLLNALLGQERAIVTDIAGTTRDSLEETVRMDGLLLKLIDTAGIRETDDIIEQIGVQKAKNYIDSSDLVLFVIDGSVPLDENDQEIFQLIKEKNALILVNKNDLPLLVNCDEIMKQSGKKILYISAKSGEGIKDISASVKEIFNFGQLKEEPVVITNVRHKKLLTDTYESLVRVKESIANQMPEDFFSIDLMDAYRNLGLIVGQEVEDDLVNEIFSKFCMGK